LCLTPSSQLIAIYTKDEKQRKEIMLVMEMAQLCSMGAGYNGAKGVIETCWEDLDEQGYYTNGIAPWREAMAASGRSMYI
jgi:hypothetical protein